LGAESAAVKKSYEMIQGKNKALVVPGQVYQGIASRYLFPPDKSDWWHTHGSYEIAIEEAGRVWFQYRSYCVKADGERLPMHSRRKAKLEELRRELAAGLITLKQASADVVIEPDE
jgi:hypothetical protein